MPKSPPKDAKPRKEERPSRRSEPESSTPFFSWLIFWPFHGFHRLIRRLPLSYRLLLRVIGDPFIAGCYIGLIMSVFYYLRAKPYDMTKVAEMPQRTIVYDRKGEELGRIHGEKRDVVPLSRVSLDFQHAIIAREDARFLSHGGVDWYGVGRSVVRNFTDRGFTQGASTLSMQLARNSFPLGTKLLGFSPKLQELDRKFLEVAVAYRIEGYYNKNEILQHYVNRIFWGHSVRGIEEASRTYFEKSAQDLTLSEAAMLAGIVRGPNAFSPFRDIDKATRERNTTLDRMVKNNFITQSQADAAKKEPLSIRPEWRRILHDSYAMDAVRRELERILEKENIELGGLIITTTLDSRIQKKAEDALDARLTQVEHMAGYKHQTRASWQALPDDKKGQPQYLQGSVVCIENLTGAILSVVGGRNADESKFNRALLAKRQIGSIFKPFVYVAAFDKGMQPQSRIDDGPIGSGEIKGAGSWRPHNSDGTFGGLRPASYGLIHSRNTMSVRVGDYAGIDSVRTVGRDVGFETDIPKMPTSYLGAFEASPMEVASAYSIFPNGGERFRPYLISEIRDKAGNVLWKETPLSYSATKQGSAWAISNILSEVTENGTAAGVKNLGFSKPCAGKTGTTNDFKDAWFAGYTSSITCAVWVGLDTPEQIIPRGYGATLALPVWAEVMKTADRLGYKATGLKSQLASVECRLCRDSGKRATPGCEQAGSAYTDRVPTDLVPAANDFCPLHPMRAEQVTEGDTGSTPVLKALPVNEDIEDPDTPPLKALPVDE
jgi:penicillin-binding protein 1A